MHLDHKAAYAWVAGNRSRRLPVGCTRRRWPKDALVGDLHPRDHHVVGVRPGDLPRLVACIDTLVDEYECDVLSISAGDWKEPLETLEIQVEEAADKGTLCFFAAGNKGELLYPARYPICLTVAALGQYGSAPENTLVAFHNQYLSDMVGGSTFIWQRSASGPTGDFCAPGIGVVWNRYGSAAKGVVAGSGVD